jgi:cytoskeletal protein RodZ
MPGMHAPPHHVAAAIAIVGIVVGVGIVSVVVGPKAKPYKRTPVKSSTVKSSTVEATASEASMETTAAKAASAKATTVEATSATAVETAAAKAASVTAAAAASVAAATTAASGRHGWLNQADSRQCEQGYNRFPHHASFLGTMSLPRVKHFRTGIIRQSKSVRGKQTVSRG